MISTRRIFTHRIGFSNTRFIVTQVWFGWCILVWSFESNGRFRMSCMFQVGHLMTHKDFSGSFPGCQIADGSQSSLLKRKALEIKQAMIHWFSSVLAGANTNIHVDYIYIYILYIYISLDIQGHLLSKIFGYIVRIRNPPTGYLQLNYCACFTGR